MGTIEAGIVGTLTADPELAFGKSGTAYARLRVSVKPYVKGATEQPPVEFHDAICFGSLAENVAESLRKGDRVAVTGKIENDEWTGRDGVVRQSTKIVAEGIGPDLRFNSAAVTRTRRSGAAKPARDEEPF